MKPRKCHTYALRFVFFAISLFLTIHPADSSAQEEPQQQTAQTELDSLPALNDSSTDKPNENAVLWELKSHSLPTLQTTVAAMAFQGRWKSDTIYLPDFDIILTLKNTRLIPLLRVLRLIEATGEIKGDTIDFSVEGSPKVLIDIKANALTTAEGTIPLEIQTGISDITQTAEVYVNEEVFAKAFGFEYTWSEERYEYRVRSPKELVIFKHQSQAGESPIRGRVQQITEALPETEPPAQPQKLKAPLSFFQTELRTEYNRRWSASPKALSTITSTPALTLWGHLLNGNYELKFRNAVQFPGLKWGGLTGWLDRGLWTSKTDNFLANLGDTNIGLSDLVAPSANLFGAAFKWLPCEPGPQPLRDKFFKSRKPSFMSVGVFEGYAYTDSSVELWINNRLIASKTVEEIENSPPGFGYYKFEGIGLLDKSINDIKFVIKRPDGVVEEIHKQVLGSTQFLPQGQWAVTGGIGTSRQKVNGRLRAQGEFAGTQIIYGLLDGVTLGSTFATQDKFAFIEDTSGNLNRSTRRHYLAQEARWKFLDHLITKGNIGLSYDHQGKDTAIASLLESEYYLKQSRLKGLLFSFNPDYSNGLISISDKRGYSLSGNLRLLEKFYTKGSFVHIYNNINKNLAVTQQEDLFTAILNAPGPLPRSSLELQFGHSERTEEDGKEVTGNMYTLSMDDKLTDKLTLSGYYSFGDEITISSSDDLKSGVPLPDLGSFYSQGTKLDVRYQLQPWHSVTLTHWKSRTREKLECSSNYSHYGNLQWRSRFTLGRDMRTLQHTANEHIEFNIDTRGDNKWGIKAGFDQDGYNYNVSFYISLRNLFFWNKGKIKRLDKKGVSFERGGIEGTVYLDINGDGHRDGGEKGVADTIILVDGRKITETDKKGNFFFFTKEKKEMVTVSLDTNSLAAIYTPTQGQQKAYCAKGAFATVNLGVCVLGSLSGAVMVTQDNALIHSVAGAKIVLVNKDTGAAVKDSISSRDGNFYIGEIPPGEYTATVDPESIPAGYTLKEELPGLTFISAEEPQAIDNYRIMFLARKTEETPQKTRESPPLKDAQAKEKETPRFKITRKWGAFAAAGMILLFLLRKLISKMKRPR